MGAMVTVGGALVALPILALIAETETIKRLSRYLISK